MLADAMYQRALRCALQILPSWNDHAAAVAAVEQSCHRLADLYLHQERYGQALAMLTRACALLESAIDVTDPTDRQRLEVLEKERAAAIICRASFVNDFGVEIQQSAAGLAESESTIRG